MTLFPIYERYLRYKTNYEGDFAKTTCGKNGIKEKPAEDIEKIDTIMETIRDDFGLSTEAEARVFWQHFRNGLCHRAAIKETGEYSAILSDHRDDLPVLFQGKKIRLDPLKLRDHLLPKFRNAPDMWKQHRFRIPTVYIRVEDDETAFE